MINQFEDSILTTSDVIQDELSKIDSSDDFEKEHIKIYQKIKNLREEFLETLFYLKTIENVKIQSKISDIIFLCDEKMMKIIFLKINQILLHFSQNNLSTFQKLFLTFPFQKNQEFLELNFNSNFDDFFEKTKIIQEFLTFCDSKICKMIEIQNFKTLEKLLIKIHIFFQDLKLIFTSFFDINLKSNTDFSAQLQETNSFQLFNELLNKIPKTDSSLIFENVESLEKNVNLFKNANQELFQAVILLKQRNDQMNGYLNQISNCNYFENTSLWNDCINFLTSQNSIYFKKTNSLKLIDKITFDLNQFFVQITKKHHDFKISVILDNKNINISNNSTVLFNNIYKTAISLINNFNTASIFENKDDFQVFHQHLKSLLNNQKTSFESSIDQLIIDLNNSSNLLSKITQKVKNIENKFLTFTDKMSNSKSTTDYSYFSENVLALKNIQTDIKTIELNKKWGIFILDFSSFSQTINELISQLIFDLLTCVHSRVAYDWSQIIEFVKINKKALISEMLSDSTDTLIESSVLKNFEYIENKVHKINDNIDNIKSIHHLLSDEYQDDMKGKEEINLRKWNDFLLLFEEKKKEIEREKGNIHQKVEAKFNKCLDDFTAIYSSISTLSSKTNLFDHLAENYEVLLKLSENWEFFNINNFDLISMMKQFDHLFPERKLQIDAIETFFKEHIGEWSVFLQFSKEIYILMQNKWLEFRFNLCLFTHALDQYSVLKLNNPQVIDIIHKKINLLREKIDILQLLIGEHFTQKTWKKVASILGLSGDFQQVTIFDVFNSHHFIESKNVFEELVRSSKNESTIQKMLEELSYFLRSFEFDFKKQVFSNSTASEFNIIYKFDIAYDSFGDKMSIIYSLQGNPYANESSDKIELLKTRLIHFENMTNMLQQAQNKWISLYPIMTSEFVKKGKRTEYLKFANTSDGFVVIINKLFNEKNTCGIFEDSDIVLQLKKMIEAFEFIQKKLFDFLEIKRVEFPRFYFLGDTDLIEFLGNCHIESAINAVIKKFFPAAKLVQMDEKKEKITGFISDLGESFKFINSISVNQNAQEWLNAVLDQIKVTLIDKVLKSLVNYNYKLSDIPIGNEQVVFLVNWFVFFNALEQDSNNYKELRTNIEFNIGLLVNNQPKCQISQNLKKSLLLDYIYQLEIINNFISNQYTIESFYFYSLLKYKVESQSAKTPTSVFQPAFFAEIASYQTNYTFEYLGNTQKLVQTPLTDKCFLTMATALTLGLGGNPYGPAGTGKTETIKSLGHSFGRLVIVFNCDETMEFNKMCRLFVGIVGSGAWGCFDEFNRLAIKELSAISQVISQIQNHQKLKNNSLVDINNLQLHVPQSYGMFITLNPFGKDYKGRNKLPQNLKILFRSFAMAFPNSETIVRISLICIGFELELALSVSKFLVELFSSASKVLDLEKCYDWGLRGLKCLVSQTEAFIVESLNSKSNAKSLSKPDSIKFIQTIQIKCIKLAIETNIIAKLNVKDKKIFIEILNVMFARFEHLIDEKLCQSLFSQYEFQKLIIRSFEELSLICFESQVQSCLKMSIILDQKIGFGIMGNSGSGKSTLLKVLKHALQINGKKIKCYQLNPKSMTKKDLFGCYVNDNTEFFEGVFVHILREAITSLNNKTYDSVWIVFEGNIDPNWCENLNSSLDDNMIYTLPTGERFLLPNTLKLIFETENFNSASMASISRIGLLNHQTDTIEFAELLNNALEMQESISKSQNINISKIMSKAKNLNINEFCTFKNIVNPKVKLFFNENEHFRHESNQNPVVEFYCNRQTSIANFIRFLEKKCLISSVGVAPIGESLLTIELHDIDLVQKDEFLNSAIEELLIQLIDHQWYFFEHKLYRLKNVILQIYVTNEDALYKLSKRLLNRLSLPDQFGVENEQKHALSAQKTIIHDNSKMIYKSFMKQNRNSNADIIDNDNIKWLISDLNVERSNFPKLIVFNVNDFFNFAEKYNLKKSKQSQKNETTFLKNNSFFVHRFEKLLYCFNEKLIQYIVFAFEPESHAEKSLNIILEFLNFERRYLSNVADFQSQIFSIMSEILADKKVCLILDRESIKNESTIAKIDNLCNFNCFGFYLEDFCNFSGLKNDKLLEEKFLKLNHNFKVILTWNSTFSNTFENIVAGYSCFSRKFVCILDNRPTFDVFDTFINNLLIHENKTVQIMFKSILKKDYSFEQITDFADIFFKIRNIKQEELNSKIKKFEKGAEKIQSAENDVSGMQSKIAQERIKMVDQQNLLDKQIDQISLASLEVETQKTIAEKLSLKLTSEKAALMNKKEIINNQLAAVVPIVEEAKLQIKSLSKTNIDELRNYHIPPEVVLDIFGVLLRLMNEQDVSWNNMKKILGKRTVIEQIVDIDPREVSPSILKEVENILAKKPDSFDKTRVFRISAAAAPIAEFVKAIICFVRTVQNVKPLEDEYKALDHHLRESEQQLLDTQKKVEAIIVKQKKLKESLLTKSLEIEEFKSRILKKEQILQKAITLFANLSQEKQRWTIQKTNYVEKRSLLDQCCLAVGFYFVYLSILAPNEAKKQIESLKKQINLPESFDLVEFLYSNLQINELLLQFHPNTQHNLINTFFLFNSDLPMMIYDPEVKTHHFFMKRLAIEELFIENDPKINLKLELAIKLGKSVVIVCEQIPQNSLIIDSFIQNVFEKNNQTIFQIGDKKIDWNEKFKIFIVVKNKILDDEKHSKIRFINYSISKESMREEIAGMLINWQSPELEINQSKCEKLRQTCQIQIFDLEEKLLIFLNESKGDILEDQKLFCALDEIKVQSQSQQSIMENFSNTLQEFQAKRLYFESLADKLACIFEVIINLRQIDPNCLFSHPYLRKRLLDFIEKWGKKFDQVEFLKQIIESFCQEVNYMLDSSSQIVFLSFILRTLSIFDNLEEQDVYQSAISIQSTSDQPVFKAIFAVLDENNETNKFKKQTHEIDSFKNDAAFQYLTQKFPEMSNKLQNNTNRKAEIQAIFNNAESTTKLLLSKLIFPELFEGLCINHISTKLKTQLFSNNMNLESILNQTFTNTILLFDNNSFNFPGQVDHLIEKQEGVISLLTGTLSAEAVLSKLVHFHDKEVIIFLKSIHAHYETESTIINFYNEFESKFNKKFRLVLSTENLDRLPTKMLENSLKISSQKLIGFRQNFLNSQSILKNNINQDFNLTLLSNLHSMVIERMNFCPIGWSSDYQFSDFELKCIHEIITQFKGSLNQNMINQLALNSFYLAKIDNENDTILMETIYRKIFAQKVTTNLSFLENNVSKEEEIQNCAGLQYNAFLIAKKESTEKICQGIRVMERGVQFNKKTQSEKVHLVFERICEFWCNFKQQLRWTIHSSQNNVLMTSFVNSEQAIFGKLLDIVEIIAGSIELYICGKIKISEVKFYEDISVCNTPSSLSLIWENSANIFEYLNSIVQLSGLLKNNLQKMLNDQFDFQLKGLISYKKLFEIFKLSYIREYAISDDSLIMTVQSNGQDGLRLIDVYIQGGTIDTNGCLKKLDDEDKFLAKKTISILKVNFLRLSVIKTEEYLSIPIFTHSNRSNHVCNVFVKVDQLEREFFILSSVALFVQD